MKITGAIVDSTDRALSDVLVVAFHGDVDLAKEKRLRSTRTGVDGEFSLAIDLARYPLGVNVRIAVLDEDSTELWSSPIHYNTKTDMEIDATIPDANLGITEYGRITSNVVPFLQGATLAKLEPTQAAYLSGRSKVPQAELNLLIDAALLHAEISDVSEEAWYGLLRYGLPTDITALVALPSTDWKEALDAATRGNIIGPLSGTKREAIVSALNARKATETLRSSSPVANGAAAFATVALKSHDKQQRVAKHVARHNGVNDAFWKAMDRDLNFTAGERERLKNYAAVSGIVGNDPELLRRIAAHLNQLGEKVSPAALASIGANTLAKLMEASARANGNGLLRALGSREFKAIAEARAHTIANEVATTFPAEALRAELRSAPQSKYFGKYTSRLERFLDRNGGLDLQNGLYDVLNPPQDQDPFRGISDKGAVKERLGTIARLSRALPGPEPSGAGATDTTPVLVFSKVATLADKGYRSSSAIAAKPRAEFVADIAMKPADEAYWGQVHDRATAVRDVALLKGIELLHTYRQPLSVIRRPREDPDQEGVANLRTLFGTLDMCDCESCGSITSPAAYLADVLNFLGTELATVQTSPYDVLIARRPDIPHILLNCDNANRELPYIDLVNELLEDEVLRSSEIEPVWAPHRRVRLDIDPAELDKAASDRAAAVPAKRVLIRALGKGLSGYRFDSELDVSVVTRGKKGGTRWHAFEHGWLVELNKAAVGKHVDVDYISRQTFGTKDELAASPAFRNARAASRLEGAKFPLNLPASLPLLETRLFLNHLQVPRERLIRLLAPKDEYGWAIEYLQLSAAEADLVTSRTVPPAEAWGFHSATVTADDVWVDPADSTKLLTGHWSDELRRVDVLIARAGISYVELLELLEADYVNPPLGSGLRPITIQSTDNSDPATCDLSKLRIHGSIVSDHRLTGAHLLSAEGDIGARGDLLDRLMRFLRLRRRTGWTTRELDLAIRQLRPGVLDDTTLSLLAALKWTKDELTLTHSDACALLGAIDTKRHIDHAAASQPTLLSQFEQLFQNRAITNPLDRNFVLGETGNELRNTTFSVESSKATLAAAFQISDAEVMLLAKQAGITKLSLQGLSSIYRRVLFARVFRLSVQDMISLESLAGSLPSVDRISTFVERVNWLLGSKLSVADAWFLLRGVGARTAHLAPGDDEIAQNLGELRTELLKIEADHGTPDPIDVDAAVLRKRLGALDWGAPLIEEVVGIVTDTKSYSVHLSSLPLGVSRLLLPGPGDPIGAPIDPGVSVPRKVRDLVAYDSDNHRIRALRPLSRSDRKRLLLASADSRFRKSVELLFALGRLSFAAETLTCRGLLSAAAVTELVNLGHTQRYKEAIRKLADQPRQVLSRKLRYCSLPVYEVDLDATSLDLRADLAAYVRYDLAQKKLVIRGQLTDAEQEMIERSAVPALPQAASQALPMAQNPGAQAVNQAELRDLLPVAADIDALFDPQISRKMPTTTAEIAGHLLTTLTPYARNVLSRKAVVGSLSTAFGLEASVMRDLVERQLPSSTGPPQMVEAFLTLIASDARSPVAEPQYPGLFDDYRRLSKIALLCDRLRIDSAQMRWVFDYAQRGKWLSAASLTSGAATGGAGLAELSDLIRLFDVAGRAPYSVMLVDDILHVANDPSTSLPALIKFILDNSPWSKSDLTEVCQHLALSAPSEFISVAALDSLLEALQATGQLGATVKEAVQLTERSLQDEHAVLAQTLAKSKHDPERWLDIVKLINDTLRESRRVALVDYLVANPRRAVGSGRPLWHDASSLYEHLLVDVEMGACMTTSRIRLALSSVQLFVQRCLMNLEPRVSVSDDPRLRAHWDEWDAWRKRYRVWEANRKVFLYPENWIEPELRDDKTPFYKELEEELLQNEVTKESAEAAFLNYLHKLDQVGKLEVMGMFVEEPAQASIRQVPYGVWNDSSTDGNMKAESAPTAHARILHVVARTYGDPRQWFYRKLTTTGEWHEGSWSPWERIDADLSGDHVLPVVWNNHFYLFWAIFERRADKPTAQERMDKDKSGAPKNRWYIKFAWSEYKQGKWSPKRVSEKALKTPTVESDDHSFVEADFSFKTDVTDRGIVVRCYGPVVGETATPPADDTHESGPAPEGYRLIQRTADCAIWFQDQYGHWDTTITVLVYQGSTKLLTLNSSDLDGLVEIWNHYDGAVDGKNSKWYKTAVDIRTRQKLYKSWQDPSLPQVIFAPADNADWAGERDYTRRNTVDPLVTRNQVVEDFPSSNAESSTAGTSRGPGLISVPPVWTMRVGRFDFTDCRGELSPTEELLAEEIPGLEGLNYQSTELRGMMYVAKEGGQSFLGRMLQAASGYRVLMPHQRVEPDTTQPFFFQDDSRVYLVTLPRPATQPVESPNGVVVTDPRRHRFDVFYHPYVCNFVSSVNRGGIDDLLTLESQALDDWGDAFGNYLPSEQVLEFKMQPDGEQLPISREFIDFDRSGAYSIYNWELFFHAPLHIATKLNANQRFEEARCWLHFIFDPTTRPGAFSPAYAQKPTQRFWNVRPFWETQGIEIHSIGDMLGGAENLSYQVAEWRREPFKPYAVARLRLIAFMQCVVMRYLDNLIDWGDQQFGQLTMESTNEATLLYMLAAEILGRRPEKIPPRARAGLQTYASLQDQAATLAGGPSDVWKNFSDLMVEIEAYIPPAVAPLGTATGSALGRMWAFCVPSNGNLLEYWRLVADRLFKLRHCQDIEGIERTIPLWDPPIDPGLLVRAAAAGVDLASVLSDINASLPNYRFTAMLPKAIELCNDVRNLGESLLSALEKKDGEELARMRARHEVELLQAIRTVRLNHVAESEELRVAAERSKLTVEARRNHYRDIPFMIREEEAGLALSSAALTQEAVAAVSDTLAAIAAWVPQFAAGTSGFYSSPVLVTTYGGEQMSRGASAAASQARSIAAFLATSSAISQTVGSYFRRRDEWKLQETLANRELDQIQKQIDAATIREAIAQAELASHELQKDQAKAVDEYLRDKHTNRELYGWLQGQLSGLYFQAYKLAFDMAKKAERAFRYELGLQDSNYVQFGYWDSLKSGLLAGERLQNDLRRMEAAYLDRNRREFEITKHVSLEALDPTALISLKSVGGCEVDIPEWLFDMDYPGHYMRRIKSVALSIPCVVGSHSSVNCTLTQTLSRVRKDTMATAADYENADHFHENLGSAQRIVTSSARQDSGLFELNFRDERYLPFEGSGAISRWRIELPRETNQFDVDTVSDVIIHIHYTSRDGGEMLREAARAKTKEKLSRGMKLFDVRADFASEWYRFKNPETGSGPELRLELDDTHFPFHSTDDSIGIQSIELIGAVDEDAPSSLDLSVKMGSKKPDFTLRKGSAPAGLRSEVEKFGVELDTIVITGQSAAVDAIEDLLLLCRYELQS